MECYLGACCTKLSFKKKKKKGGNTSTTGLRIATNASFIVEFTTNVPKSQHRTTADASKTLIAALMSRCFSHGTGRDWQPAEGRRR